MEEIILRHPLRERILNDLRNIVKQVYHESVNNELSPENKSYVCLTLIRNLDEALCHGLKQLHLGYWKPICQIIHPQMRYLVEQLPVHNLTECNNLAKGRAWIALSLKDDSFINYIQCLVTEVCLEKFYEDWSILRSSDSCNHFLSILSGLDNVIFTYEVNYVNRPPTFCNFGKKAISSEQNKLSIEINDSKSSVDLGTMSSSSLTSPIDSDSHINDTTSDLDHSSDDKEADIDFLNGNIPETTVYLRKSKKNTKRHVSFHEDIIYKSPEKCRKLKWDSENLRYSWSGEEIDSSILKESNFSKLRLVDNKSSTPLKSLDINVRGTPEGEEAPSKSETVKQSNKAVKQRPVVVKRFLQSIKGHSKNKFMQRKLTCTSGNLKQIKVDLSLASEINDKIKRELELKPKPMISKNEVHLNPEMVKEMIRNQTVYKSYKLRNYLFIITNCNIYLVNGNLEVKRINYKNLSKIVVYPDAHSFLIYESDEEYHISVTGDGELTNEVLGRLEFTMRRNQYDPPEFYILNHGDLSFIMRNLVEKVVIDRNDELVYCGAVFLVKENDLLSTSLPSSKWGFLMYRYMQAGEGWIPGDFCLKNGILYLIEEGTSRPKLAINISTGCQSCSRTKNPDRPHTFQITLVEKEVEYYSKPDFTQKSFNKSKFQNSETYKLLSGIRQKVNKLLMLGGAKESCSVIEFAAANPHELSEWLEMIIQASCGDSCEEAHKEDLIEGTLLVTKNSMTITNEIWSPSSEMEIISCAQLRDVAALRIGESTKDLFTVIEFVCMEASSTSGDWILHFSSREELKKLIYILESLWKSHEKFPCSELMEGRLMSRCKKSQDNLNDNSWSLLLQ